jgi:hypothetical protein
MKYTYTKKVETVETVTKRPSDIYSTPDAKQNIEKLLATYEIVDFRRPSEFDQFIAAQYGSSVMERRSAWVAGDEPRFIVVPKVPKTTEIDTVWE